jgi:hypothetical protein
MVLAEYQTQSPDKKPSQAKLYELCRQSALTSRSAPLPDILGQIAEQ